jgi:hypothetical protein
MLLGAPESFYLHPPTPKRSRDVIMPAYELVTAHPTWQTVKRGHISVRGNLLHSKPSQASRSKGPQKNGNHTSKKKTTTEEYGSAPIYFRKRREDHGRDAIPNAINGDANVVGHGADIPFRRKHCFSRGVTTGCNGAKTRRNAGERHYKRFARV